MRQKSHPKREEIQDWLKGLNIYEITGKSHREIFDHSYNTWARCSNAWKFRLGMGGTYTLRAIMWYQHVYKPGSTDSRPAIIIPAILETIQKEGENE